MKALLSLLLLLLCLVNPLQAKELLIGTDSSFPPFEFKENGKFVGFDIDLLDAITKELGITYRLQGMDFNGLIPALQTGNIDLAVAGMTIKPERKKVVDFSRPYYKAGLRILVRADETRIKSMADLKNKAVAVKLGTTSADFIKGKVGRVRLFPQITECYMELSIGAVDAVIYDTPAMEHYANTAGKGRVKLVGPLYEGQTYGIAFPKGSPLRAKFDKVLGRLMENGVYAKLFKKWFGRMPDKL
ncbi:MAG: transporter substrate-binding domain-containing protein [SAR324 cluster bacterium]|nr:transporter substrate-binding domain-containing protein [SAR324 cluster bacterium]